MAIPPVRGPARLCDGLLKNDGQASLVDEAVEIEYATLALDAETAVARDQHVVGLAHVGRRAVALGAVDDKIGLDPGRTVLPRTDADVTDHVPRLRVREFRVRGFLHEPLRTAREPF